MKKRVVDAAVAAKWVFPEEGSSEASEILQSVAAGDTELLAPDTFLSDIGGIALKKAIARKEISPQEAREGLRFLCSVLPRLVPSLDLLDSAIEIALTHRRGIRDCLYVALALREECDLVTADQTLVRALGASYSCIKPLRRSR